MTGEYQCTVEVVTGSTRCRAVGASGADGGARLDLALGVGPLTFVNSWVHARGNPADEDTSTTSLAFVNNAGQPIGTTDGTTPAAAGNRVFFTTPPYVASVSSGTVAGAFIRLDNATGTADFTSVNPTATWTNRPFYAYHEIVAPGGTSSSKPIRYVYSSNVRSFGYGYRVMAPVRYEWGWITITPSAVPVLGPGETAVLTGTAYSSVGQVLTEPITWSGSNPAAATVNPSTGEVTAVGEGTAVITATSAADARRTGTRAVTVDAAPLVTGTTPAANATFPSANDIVITFSEPVFVSGSSFTVGCTTGPRYFAVSGSGTAVITLDPDASLPTGDTCTVTVLAEEVMDADANDGPDSMAANYSFSFQPTGFGGDL